MSAMWRGLRQMPCPDGLLAVPDLLSEAEEAALLAAVHAAPWDETLSRRVQHYGHRYAYARRASATGPVADVPEWALQLYATCCAAAAGADLAAAPGELQVIVNEYLPGQGIAAHIDDRQQFGDWVVAVSLGGACEMEFVSRRTGDKHRVRLAPRSMYAMTGDSRHRWTHAIAARKSDPAPGGGRVARATRVSITFRSLRRM